MERFASAMVRRAKVRMVDGTVIAREGGTTNGHALMMPYFRGCGIFEIIEPTVLRDWTFNDAMNHLGFSIRRTGAKEDVYTINRATHCKPFCDFTFSEYAAPIPGTDPAKWDWKPCKVEVPVEAPKFDVLTELRVLRHAFSIEFLDRIIKRVEQS